MRASENAANHTIAELTVEDRDTSLVNGGAITASLALKGNQGRKAGGEGGGEERGITARGNRISGGASGGRVESSEEEEVKEARGREMKGRSNVDERANEIGGGEEKEDATGYFSFRLTPGRRLLFSCLDITISGLHVFMGF